MMSTLFVLALVASFIITGEARTVESSYSDELSQESNVAVKKATASTAKLIQRPPQQPVDVDINACLFRFWKSVITTPPPCTGKELCYGLSKENTKFAVCYDTDGKIPEYVAYIMEGATGSGRNDQWTIDAKLSAAVQANLQSYDSGAQTAKYGPTYKWDHRQNYFLGKGHLTPNMAFSLPNERELTFVFTNAAPQWQKFNGGNWRVVEEAIKNYAVNVERGIYVLTGVHGTFRDRSKTNPLPDPLYMNTDKVDVPEYFWTIVCDPGAAPNKGKSIAFIAKNNVGDMTRKIESGCNSEAMTSQNGVLNCMSVVDFKSRYPDIKVPTFHSNCQDGTKGTFLDSFYTGKFQ